MRNYLAILTGVVLLVGLFAPTAHATPISLAAADQAQKAKMGKDKAAEQAKHAEKMLRDSETSDVEIEDTDDLEDARARAKGHKKKSHKKSDEDEQSLDDQSSDDASSDDKSEKSLDDGSSDDESHESADDGSVDDSADDDSGDKSDKAARKGERGEHGRMKAEEKRAANKQRQEEKREMVEAYQEDSKTARAEGKLAKSADTVDDPDAAVTDAQQKKAKKPWWRFWGN